jgi:hypothetical protein
MADDVVGGLEQASPYEKAQAKYQEQITRLSKIQDDLMASLDTRQGAGNPLLALAQGFLAPTRGGGFGESAGNALQSMGAQQQLEQKQSPENAMMRMQLAQQSLTPYKEQMELARRSSMSGDLRKLLGAGGQTIQGPEAATIARSVGVAPFSNEAASLIGRPSPTASGGNNVFGNIDATTRGLLMSQAGVDPEGVMKELATFGMKESGRTDKMKEMEYFANQFPGADRAKLMQVAAARSLLGDPTTLVTAIKSVQEMIDQEQDIPTNKAIKAFLLSQLGMYGYGSPAGAAQGSGQPATSQFGGTPPAIPQIGATPPSSSAVRPPIPAAAIPAAPATDADIIRNAPANTSTGQIPKGASVEDAARIINSSIPDPDIRRILLEDYRKGVAKPLMPVMTSMLGPTVEPAKMASTGEGLNKRERAILEAEQKEEAVGKAKERVKDRSMFKLGFDTASDNLAISDQVYEIVSNNPNAFGILSKPGFAPALGSLVQDAMRIGTYSIGIPGIQDAIRKIGGTQADIDAVSKFDQLAVNLALAIAATQKGLGSITNYEREMFAKAAFSSNDSANVLLYKSELLRARSTFDKVRWQQYYEFERSKSGSIEDYKMSPSYQALRNKYEATLKQIAKTYQK